MDPYKQLIEKAFIETGLPEVSESQLETGTYTNAQIVEKLVKKLFVLFVLLARFREMNTDSATKRSMLSFAVEMSE